VPLCQGARVRCNHTYTHVSSARVQSWHARSEAVHHNKRTQTVQHTKTLLRTLVSVTVLGIATLVLPLSVHAGVRVAIGVGLPVVVAPAPVVVAPPPPAVVYPAPVVVASPPVVVAPPPVVYGSAPVLVGRYYGYYHRPWRHPYYRWHRW